MLNIPLPPNPLNPLLSPRDLIDREARLHGLNPSMMPFTPEELAHLESCAPVTVGFTENVLTRILLALKADELALRPLFRLLHAARGCCDEEVPRATAWEAFKDTLHIVLVECPRKLYNFVCRNLSLLGRKLCELLLYPFFSPSYDDPTQPPTSGFHTLIRTARNLMGLSAAGKFVTALAAVEPGSRVPLAGTLLLAPIVSWGLTAAGLTLAVLPPLREALAHNMLWTPPSSPLLPTLRFSLRLTSAPLPTPPNRPNHRSSMHLRLTLLPPRLEVMSGTSVTSWSPIPMVTVWSGAAALRPTLIRKATVTWLLFRINFVLMPQLGWAHIPQEVRSYVIFGLCGLVSGLLSSLSQLLLLGTGTGILISFLRRSILNSLASSSLSLALHFLALLFVSRAMA